jgi:SAM-dependent methyltransferase
MSTTGSANLQRLYEKRFKATQEYRRAVWKVLIADLFQDYVTPGASVLDLGCGYGEFINQIQCGTKFAMDLNPDAPSRLSPGVKCLLQDCSAPWNLPDHSLDLVFTSNFFEHLPDKESLGRTLDQAHRRLKPGGLLIALGPNVKFLPGAYWDFWDHHVPLTELSLAEAMTHHGFEIDQAIPQFLPYTLVGGRKYPLWTVRLYLKCRFAWPIFGKQFLVICRA